MRRDEVRLEAVGGSFGHQPEARPEFLNKTNRETRPDSGVAHQLSRAAEAIVMVPKHMGSWHGDHGEQHRLVARLCLFRDPHGLCREPSSSNVLSGKEE